MIDYSQFGEQGIVLEIFRDITPPLLKVCIEIGAGDGYKFSNTRHFIEDGWKGYMFEIQERLAKKCKDITCYKVTPENVNEIIGNYTKIFDLLSIDIDGYDYWVWKEITFEPIVVIIEWNRNIPMDKMITVPYDSNFKHDGSDYYGASFSAMLDLGKKKGYSLYSVTPTNLIFINNNYLSEQMLEHFENSIRYWKAKMKAFNKGWKIDNFNREWYDIEKKELIKLNR